MKYIKFGMWMVLLCISALDAEAYVFIEEDFICEHDVDNKTKALVSNNPNDFWESMVANNQTYQLFLKACHKNEKTEEGIRKWKERWPKFDVHTNPDVLRDRENLCRRIFSRVGLNDSISCCIVNDTTFNSFSIFGPQGNVVALSVGLVDTPGMTDEMIIGMAAHEYAHIYLNHILQNSYLRAKVEGHHISTLGIIGGAIGGAIYGMASGNAIALWTPKGKNINDYNTKFYREIELEADLIAYRFMEWSGIGGEHYIRLLRMIGAKDPEGYLGDKNSYYTSHQERIKFINYVKNHPELGNVVNDKILKKLNKKKK